MSSEHVTQLCRGVLLVLCTWLAACQPTPDESFASAQRHFAAAEYRTAIIELKNVLQVQPNRAEARLMLAEASFILNDLATAESEYRRVLALGAGDVGVWVAYGRAMLGQEKAPEALALLQPELEEYPDSSAAQAMLGDIYRALGNQAQADDHYQQALENNPSEPAALVGAAELAILQGDIAKAEAFSEEHLNAHPESPLAWRSRGDVLAAAQRYAEAALAYDRAIDAEVPSTTVADRFNARHRRVSVLIEARQLDTATARLDGLRTFVADHPIIDFLAGRIAFAAGDYDEAEDALLRYLAVIPRDPRGQAILGAINFSKNNLGQAEQYLSSAVRSDVGGDMVRLLLAETQLRLDRPRDAAAVLGGLESDQQESAITLAMLGRANLDEGNLQAAIDYFRRSLEQDGDSRDVNLALAASFIASGNYADAVELLRRLDMAGPGDYRRETLLMVAYLQLDNREAVETLARSLLSEHYEDANVHALVGVLYLNLGSKGRAEAQLATALQIDPDNVGAHYALGSMALADRDLQTSVEHFHDVLDIQPAHIPALIDLTTALQGLGTLDRLMPRLDAALAAEPENTTLKKLGHRVALMIGDAEVVRTEIERDRQEFPDDADFLYLEGMVHWQDGDMPAAIVSLSRAAAADPNNAKYQLDLARARLANRDYSKAIEAVRAYRALRPDDIEGIAVEVDAQIRSGDPGLAREAVRVYASKFPDQDFIWMLHGDVDLASNDAAAAISWYQRYAERHWNRVVALRLAAAHEAAGSAGSESTEFLERWLADEPQDTGVRRIYAQLLEANGRTNDAIREYEALVENDQLDAVGLNNLAWQYMLLGRSEAAELAARAHEMRPASGPIADTYGWILYQQGEPERALELLRTASRRAPGNGEIRYHLAEVLTALGETDEARVTLEELLRSSRQFPSRAAAEELLERL